MSLTPEQMQLIVDRLPVVVSVVDIARELDVSREDVWVYAGPLIQLMQASGALPPCGCGRARFHKGQCAWKRSLQPHRYQPISEETLARRTLAVEMLAAGMRKADVEKALGMPRQTAKEYVQFLTPDQMAQRERFLERRGRQRTPETQAEHRRAIIGMLIAGYTYSDIAEANGIAERTVCHYVGELTPDQRAARRRVLQSRAQHQGISADQAVAA